MTVKLLNRYCIALVGILVVTNAFQAYHPCATRLRRRAQVGLWSQATEDLETESDSKPCFYRGPNERWEPRINLSDLQVGQQLSGKVVQELLTGKTGPKVFFDCGVGRTDKHGNWHIVHGMLRLGGPGAKASVTKKRATRLRRKDQVELFVSRIQLGGALLEVCTSPEEVTKYSSAPPKIPASSLKPKQELVGTVTKVVSFGVFVDVGANRNGLLHIQKVADLYGRYIDKEKGLAEAGLERGARIRVAVESNEKKRLFLDFTHDVKKEAEEEREQEAKITEETVQPPVPAAVAVQDSIEMSEEEAAAWELYATSEEYYEGEEEDYEDGEPDEDAAIEDAFGLGMY